MKFTRAHEMEISKIDHEKIEIDSGKSILIKNAGQLTGEINKSGYGYTTPRVFHGTINVVDGECVQTGSSYIIQGHFESSTKEIISQNDIVNYTTTGTFIIIPNDNE